MNLLLWATEMHGKPDEKKNDGKINDGYNQSDYGNRSFFIFMLQC